MNVYHIVHSVENLSAGPSYSVPSLLQSLNEIDDVSTELITPNPSKREWPYKVTVKKIKNADYISPIAFSDSSKFMHNIIDGKNILHGHGVWRASNLFYLLKKQKSNCRLLCSPRGMLTPWAMNQRKNRKSLFWMSLQKPALNKVDCFHVTAETELEDIRRLGFRQPVAVIPNGIDIPVVEKTRRKENKILFLSRINRKKGLDILLEAWSGIYEEFPDWSIAIAGPQYEKYAKIIIIKCNDMGIRNIEFVGEALGEDKKELYESSKIFVLPSYSENFGIVVAEALSYSIPVITTTGTPWQKIEDKDCGWFIEPNKEQLTAALKDAIQAGDSRLQIMGKKGRSWMQESFAWRNIANDMKTTYNWLLHQKKTKPEFVFQE